MRRIFTLILNWGRNSFQNTQGISKLTISWKFYSFLWFVSFLNVIWRPHCLFLGITSSRHGLLPWTSPVSVRLQACPPAARPALPFPGGCMRACLRRQVLRAFRLPAARGPRGPEAASAVCLSGVTRGCHLLRARGCHLGLQGEGLCSSVCSYSDPRDGGLDLVECQLPGRGHFAVKNSKITTKGSMIECKKCYRMVSWAFKCTYFNWFHYRKKEIKKKSVIEAERRMWPLHSGCLEKDSRKNVTFGLQVKCIISVSYWHETNYPET